MAEPTLEDSIEILLERVPKPVRDFVLTDLSQTVQGLMGKHNLHVDQGGLLQRELLLMLLGQEEPADFMKELRAAGIEEQTVQALITDINEIVFKPLRKKEQEGGAADPAPSQQPAPQAPSTPDVPVDVRGVRTMQADVQSASQAPQPPPQQPVWQAPQYAHPAYPPMQPVYTPYPPPYMPMPPQQQTYWVPVSVAGQPQPYPYPPQQAPVQQQVPEPPKPEPVVPPTPEPTPPPAWTPPPVPPQPQYAPPPQVPLTKEFGADPYREPI